MSKKRRQKEKRKLIQKRRDERPQTIAEKGTEALAWRLPASRALS